MQEADAEKQAGTGRLAEREDLEPVKAGSALKTPKTLRRTRAEPERFITSSSAICALVGELAANGESHYDPATQTRGSKRRESREARCTRSISEMKHSQFY